MAGKKPDYRLHAMNKSTDEKNRVGAGWSNPDGSISVRIDPFVRLESDPDLVLTLFPEKRE